MALSPFMASRPPQSGTRDRDHYPQQISWLLLNASQEEFSILLASEPHRFYEGRKPGSVHVVDLRESNGDGVRSGA